MWKRSQVTSPNAILWTFQDMLPSAHRKTSLDHPLEATVPGERLGLGQRRAFSEIADNSGD
ncbi:MAG: hypothetical protein ACPF1Y_18410 [Desulfobacterota bacterium U4-17]